MWAGCVHMHTCCACLHVKLPLLSFQITVSEYDDQRRDISTMYNRITLRQLQRMAPSVSFEPSFNTLLWIWEATKGVLREVRKRIFVLIAFSETVFPPHSFTGNACWTESSMTPFLKMKRLWCLPPITSRRSLTSSRPLQKGKKEKFGWIFGGYALWRRVEMRNERWGCW